MNTHEALAADRATKLMEPFLLRPPVSYDASTYESDSVFSFPGEHFCFVVSGIVEIDFPDRIVRLEAGDSIYFDQKFRTGRGQLRTRLLKYWSSLLRGA